MKQLSNESKKEPFWAEWTASVKLKVEKDFAYLKNEGQDEEEYVRGKDVHNQVGEASLLEILNLIVICCDGGCIFIIWVPTSIIIYK